MLMKRILYIAMMCLFVAGFTACSDEEEKILSSKQQSMLNFLTKTLKLKTYEEAMDPASEENAPFYTVHGEWVYRWIKNYYDAGRNDLPQVYGGSQVALTLSIYEFTGSKISESTIPLYTNDPEMRSRLETAGLNLEYWSFEPYWLKVGSGNAIGGLDLALEGCRLNDQVEVYMTFTEAYDRDWFATLAPDSSVAVFFTINNVI